jgi:hypothetical protein
VALRGPPRRHVTGESARERLEEIVEVAVNEDVGGVGETHRQLDRERALEVRRRGSEHDHHLVEIRVQATLLVRVAPLPTGEPRDSGELERLR